jgi:ankyrin repeat protein
VAFHSIAVDAQDKCGVTPLINTVYYDNTESVMRVLLAAGAKLGVKGNMSRSALGHAAACKREEAVRLLSWRTRRDDASQFLKKVKEAMAGEKS